MGFHVSEPNMAAGRYLQSKSHPKLIMIQVLFMKVPHRIQRNRVIRLDPQWDQLVAININQTKMLRTWPMNLHS